MEIGRSVPARPRAIAMWDFSWLERRWPGAGYEDWDTALDELTERGYDAVRIDAFPHLVASDPAGQWELREVWSIQDWGSPDTIRIRVQPALNRFIAACRDRGVKVGLSSWFRQDATEERMRISRAEDHAQVWTRTIATIAEAGLLDAILYVDLCNEWPGGLWAPFFKNDPPNLTWGYWHTDASMRWMETAISSVRTAYPDLLYTFSFDNIDVEQYSQKKVPFLDLAEHHIWMAKENNGEFYREIKERSQASGRPVDVDGLFSNQVYKNLAAEAEKLYSEKPEYWRGLLTRKIESIAQHAAAAGLPLATTECWGVVDYKDWPLLNWDWVKEICQEGTRAAAASGQWIAIATSNFCGPQFVGMWRDVEWHRTMTSIIKNAPIRDDLLTEKTRKALA